MVLAAPAPVATPLPRDVDRAVPVVGRGELVLEVAACAVGRTDLQQVEGETIPRRLPIVPGTRSSAAWRLSVREWGPGANRLVAGLLIVAFPLAIIFGMLQAVPALTPLTASWPG